MARLLHILFVVFYRRTLLCLVVLALAWDFYYVGPKESVLLYGVLTLSERALEGSRHFPDFMDQAYDALRSFFERINNAAAVVMDTYAASAPATEGVLSDDVAWAMTMAAQRTGVSKDYLTKVARLESGLHTDATDVADEQAGLYLLNADTWMGLMHEFGGDYGLGGFAHEIRCTDGRNCSVGNREAQQAILDQRHDGMTATFLMAELTRKNRTVLDRSLGRAATDQDLYLAHVMGADATVQLMKTVDQDPFASASDLLPAVATQEAALFFGPLGSQRTVATVHTLLTDKWSACQKGTTQIANRDRNVEPST